jgi:hypothetical protein
LVASVSLDRRQLNQQPASRNIGTYPESLVASKDKVGSLVVKKRKETAVISRTHVSVSVSAFRYQLARILLFLFFFACFFVPFVPFFFSGQAVLRLNPYLVLRPYFPHDSQSTRLVEWGEGFGNNLIRAKMPRLSAADSAPHDPSCVQALA